MASTKANRPTVDDDLDNFDVDDFADPFADSGDENAKAKGDTNPKKRKDASGLGIEEEVNVAKKQRVPNVKLDETRLLSDKGIPKLRRKARELKFKGKGHEFSDTARLLSWYQLWLDDLFPKAKFLDALAMIEKTGHSQAMKQRRKDWIDEGKPKPPGYDDDAEADEVPAIITDILGRDATTLPARVAPIFQQNRRSSERPQTPAVGDALFGDEDVYDVTPRGSKKAAPGADTAGGEPDDEDLDALMAEEEAQRAAPSTSLFGNGGSLFGSGKPAPTKQLATRPAVSAAVPDDEDDLDALMAEAEAQTTSASSRPPTTAQSAKPNNNHSTPATADDEEDDLDALMAEAEAAESRPPPTKSQPPAQVEKSADADEEEAMAEMDGLW
ncbi:uncharacterized protein PG998_012046 [Apiospora kogelbergensis]|uniref:uncharacterized protein n=1 Tax=Apiospora kogelbergensis TaxID=1337665 RepID=UPI00312EB131